MQGSVILFIFVLGAMLSPPVGRVMSIHAADGGYMHLCKLHSWPKYVVKYNLCATNKLGFIPAKLEALRIVGLVLAYLLRRWPNTNPTLDQHLFRHGSRVLLTGFTHAGK